MGKASLSTFAVAALLAVNAVLSGCAKREPDRLVVLAAASMQGALDEVAADWEAAGGSDVVISYSATPSVARQVAAGAPADVIITSDDRWMNWLGAKDLLRGRSRAIAGNRLVVVAPRHSLSPVSIEQFAFSSVGGQIALAETQSVPAGTFAQQALQQSGLWDRLQSRVVQTDNVRGALALAERGEVRLAIVYESDARLSQNVRVVERIDTDLHRPIRYYAAIAAGSQSQAAREFLDYLSSEQGQARLASYGFERP